MSDVTMSIQLQHYNPVAYIIRGDVYKALGEKEKARADYETAKKIYDAVEKVRPRSIDSEVLNGLRDRLYEVS
jgi:predicted negative regulator of RcsB-dependent stress response